MTALLLPPKTFKNRMETLKLRWEELSVKEEQLKAHIQKFEQFIQVGGHVPLPPHFHRLLIGLKALWVLHTVTPGASTDVLCVSHCAERCFPAVPAPSRGCFLFP